MPKETALARKIRDFTASVIGEENEELLNTTAGKIRNAIPDLPGLAGEAEKKRKEAGMRKGGPVKKMKGGGMCRGMGAASKGGNYKVG